ncbi:hypothetical protein JG687_00008619 [Phytophthora cactorum]|uniref:Uncharacterized protein n=1 Tax=Phytophthora cactorum TaxID=29920 RepID=A0A8T1UEB8_9STRA|nr:hypothetical protein JG687_00008619 [Phytophthora cactorum]
MLLLLQNDIGQIIGRRLTRSENHNDTHELLEHVKGAFDDGANDDEWFIVCDNANAIRRLVVNVFGNLSTVRQDPFHVIQRFTETVKGKSEKKTLSKSSMMRSIVLMESCVHRAKWKCALQVRRGDLFVENNVYNEGGGNAVRIVPTSQLEGFHSVLKKMLARNYLSSLQRSHQHNASVRELLAKQLAFTESGADPCDDNTPREQELQIQLFTVFRKMGGIRKKRQVVAMVYDFACSVCAGIRPKTLAFMFARWDNLKHKSNLNASLKIKLKLPPEVLSSIRSGDREHICAFTCINRRAVWHQPD